MHASHACALTVTLAAGWLAGSALLNVESALPLVQVGLAASGLLLLSRVRGRGRWDTAVRAGAWALVATCAIVLLGRVSGATYGVEAIDAAAADAPPGVLLCVGILAMAATTSAAQRSVDRVAPVAAALIVAVLSLLAHALGVPSRGAAMLGGELGTTAVLALLAIGWTLITPYRWLVVLLTSPAARPARALATAIIVAPFVVVFVVAFGEYIHLYDASARALLFAAGWAIAVGAALRIAQPHLRLLETGHPRLLDQMRDGEARLRLALDHLPIVLATADRDLRYQWAYNAERTFGEVDVIGKRDDELASPQSVAELLALKRWVLQTGVLTRRQLRIGEPGNERFYDVIADPLTAPDGSIEGVKTAANEITELRQTEERLRLSLAASNAGVWEWDIVGGTVYWSIENFVLYGMPPRPEPLSFEEATGYVDPADIERMNRGMWKALSGDFPEFRAEFRIRHPERGTVWLLAVGRVTRATDGTAVRVSGINVDITEEKNAAATLLDERQFVAHVLEVVPSVVYVRDLRDRSLVFVNRHVAEVIGYTPDEVIGLGGDFIPKLVHPDDVVGLADYERELATLADDATVRREYRLRHRDGRWRWFLCNETVFRRDSNGQPLQVIGTASDITERKQAEDLRNESERQLRSIADHLPGSAVFRFAKEPDGERHFMSLSGGIREINGILVEDVLRDARNIVDVVPAGYREQLLRIVDRSERELVDLDLEVPMHRPDGKLRWLHLRSRPYQETSGRIVWDGVVTDITRAKRREGNARLLSELVDEVAMASNDAAIMRCVGERLVEYLAAQRVLFIEIDAEGRSATNLYVHGSAEPPDASAFPLAPFQTAEFQSEFLQGKPIAIDDAATDPRTAPFAVALHEFRTHALLSAPCVLAGRVRFVLAVDKADVYPWRLHEIELVQELATRTVTHIERARAEIRLRESEERLRLATQISGYGFYDYDPVRSDVHWTAELAAIHGMNADDEITSEKIQALIHSDDRERTMRAMLDSLEPDGTGDFVQEYRIVRADTGEIRWLFNRGRTFFEGVGANRHPVRCAGVVGDVTTRRMAEEALRETGERLRLAQAAGGVGTWEWNATTDEANWSAEAWEIFEPGGSGDVTYERWLKVIHPDDRERAARAVSHALAGASYSDEFRVVHPGGEIAWLEARGRVERTRSGQVMRGTIRDVTERHHYEAALHAADRQKDEFMAMLAHELRNPLAAIRNGIELLTRTSPANEDANGLLAMLRRQTGQLNRLVDDLLDVSRITQGRITLHEEDVEVGAIVAHAVETAEPLILGKHQVLTVDIHAGPFYVRGDRVRLVQALGNVLHNAAKYTDSGGTLRVDVNECGGDVAISVTDNGAGIAADLMPQIFDPFVQSERTLDRAQGGLGLGLSIVKRLIEMHGGSIAAQSGGAGAGSTFTIRLPRIAVSDSARGTGTGGVDIPRRRVLVVDDNADAADALGMLLRLDEHDVDVVYDATAAIEVAARTRPDVVLLDIGLPQFDGYEVARRLRSNPQLAKMRIVALSGYDPHESWEPETEELFDAYLIKPADPEALRPILAACEPRTESTFY